MSETNVVQPLLKLHWKTRYAHPSVERPMGRNDEKNTNNINPDLITGNIPSNWCLFLHNRNVQSLNTIANLLFPMPPHGSLTTFVDNLTYLYQNIQIVHPVFNWRRERHQLLWPYNVPSIPFKYRVNFKNSHHVSRIFRNSHDPVLNCKTSHHLNNIANLKSLHQETK